MKIAFNPRLQMWVPPGLAHRFLVLSDSADFLYKTTDLFWGLVFKKLIEQGGFRK